MRFVLRVAIAAAMQTCLILPASAQWQGTAGLSQRQVTHTEYDNTGRQLVRESGWLPGLLMGGAYQSGRHTWLAEAEISKGDIDYNGQSQAGVAAHSRTAMQLSVLRLGGRYAFGANYSALVAMEWDRSRRDILGIAGAAGLQEKYSTRRLIAGARKTWHPAQGTVAVNAAVVLSQPERLQVGFSGLLDPASLDTKRSHGVRIDAGVRPASAPWLELRSRFDWNTVPRSDDVAVTREGQFVGTIAQPEHVQRAIALTLAVVF